MQIHVVSNGETLHSLSEKYGISESRIVNDNALFSPYKLVKGQALIIGTQQKTYTVRGGDTWQTVAARLGVDPLSLRQCNPNITGERLLPSQILHLRSSDVQPEIFVSAYTEDASVAQIERRLPCITALHIQNATYMQNGVLSLMENAAPLVGLAERYRTLPILSIACTKDKSIQEILFSGRMAERFLNSSIQIAKQGGFAGVEWQCACKSETESAKVKELLAEFAEKCKENGLLMFSQGDPSFGCGTVLSKFPDEEKYRKLCEVVSYAYCDDNSRKMPVADMFHRMQVRSEAVEFDVEKQISVFRPAPSRTSDSEVIYFEDARSIMQKIKHIKENDFGGVAIRSLTYDSPILWELLSQNFCMQKTR